MALADERARIGIKSVDSNQRLVYICTFGKQKNKFYYECEIAKEGYTIDTDNFEVSETEDDVSLNEILNKIERHLLK